MDLNLLSAISFGALQVQKTNVVMVKRVNKIKSMGGSTHIFFFLIWFNTKNVGIAVRQFERNPARYKGRYGI
jgi:hypothetical protein